MTKAEELLISLMSFPEPRGEKSEIDDRSNIVQLARNFCEEAANQLTSEEFEKLEQFFQKKLKFEGSETAALSETIKERWSSFKADEVAVSKLSKDMFTEPSGAIDSTLAIMLHIRHIEEEDIPAEQFFWEGQSLTISALKSKGFSEQANFGFDFHSRAEVGNNHPHCTLKRWPKGTRKLHNDFARYLLQTIHCPLLLIAGSCAWSGYIELHQHNVRVLRVQLREAIFVNFALEFGNGFLRRVAGHIPHPGWLFFDFKNIPDGVPKLDTVCNLFLWLGGQEFISDSFEKIATGRNRWGFGRAPIGQLYAYRQIERTEGRVLSRKEYSIEFLTFAGAYCDQTLESFFKSGSSLANEIIAKIGRNIGNASYRAGGRSHDLKQQLLAGHTFQFYRHRHHSATYQIRGMTLRLPYRSQLLHYRVVLHCDLVEPGLVHPFACAKMAPTHEPASRLGIRFVYVPKSTGIKEEQWWQPEATHKHMCQMNTLVDFLDGHRAEYSLARAHRYLAKKTFKKHVSVATYTECSNTDCRECSTS